MHTKARNLAGFLAIVALATGILCGAETTPLTLPGAETAVYAPAENDTQSLRLYVVKPDGWKVTDKRPALIFFFGGAWTRGTPAQSIGWAKLAAGWGMIGIAPDYRTKERYGTTPLDAVKDARAAYAWVLAHAAELGIDSAKIVVGGNSAGAHLALWTAIKTPTSSETENGKLKTVNSSVAPAALVLVSTPADLSDPKVALRFGPHIADVSPLQHVDAKMPPTIMLHGTDDKTVPYSTVVPLAEKLKATGNICELITVQGGAHNFSSTMPEWKEKTRALIKTFLTDQKILP